VRGVADLEMGARIETTRPSPGRCGEK